MKLKFFIVLGVFILSGCSNGLVQDTYKYTKNGNGKETHTAFIILSHIELNQAEIEKIEDDYKNETVSSRKFLYEYLLAKRTQEDQYVSSFIKSSENNLPILLHNSSTWISMGSPTLELLSIYSKTNDTALSVLLELLFESDGVNQSVIASNLRDVYELQPTRFIALTKKMEFDLNNILLLMEDE